MRKILTLLVFAIAIAVAITKTVDHLGAASNAIVISQVYGGGGNSGATYKNDFIELFNRSDSDVDVTGWSVQYASAATGTWSGVTTLSGTIHPGHYYLVQEAAGTNGTTNLPPPDATGSIAMSATSAKVALVNTATALSGTCPTGTSIVDLVGYGTGSSAPSCFETAPAPTLTNTTADARAGGGCTDSDNNGADFTPGAANPRNASSPITSCGGGGGDSAPSVSTTSPAGGATNIASNSSIVINFSESVTASASAFSLACPAGTPQPFTQSTSPNTTFTLTPTSPLPPATSCVVKVTASQVTDTDTIDPPDAMASDFSFSFSTVNPVDAAPFVASVTPLNGASDVPVTSPIVVNFSESVTPSPSAFSIQCPVGVPQGFIPSAAPAATFTLTHSAPLPNGTVCTVSVLANQISDTDTNDPPDGMASDVAFSFTTAAAPPPGAGKVMINEIDADTPGSDTAEFIELYDGGSGNTPLDGLVVVLFDGTASGAGNQSYAAFDLDGFATDSHGYFVLGNPGVPNASITFQPGPFGLLQNGPDAVALYVGHASAFPNGTALTTTSLLDAIVYGTDDFSASGLLPLLNPGQKIVNEDAAGNSETQSSQRCANGMGGFRNTSPYYPGTPTPGAANNCPAARPPSDVVISQIYGGGGNSGAVYQNDYVELYNRGTAPADLTGWSLQYSSATGSSWDLNRQPLGGAIGPGQYYLVALASGGANGVPLPVAPNVSSQINIAAGSGNVALVSSYAGLVGACPIFDPTLKDLVGYGTADCGEGSTMAPGLSNTTALFRKDNGALDTDNNATDFGAPANPNPRRTAPIVELGPAVLSTDPATNGTDAPRDATILVTFTETVNVDSGWFSLVCASSGTHSSATFAANRGGQDQYITPNDNFTAGERCTVTIFKDRVHDVDLDDSAPNTDTLPADYTWAFTVATGTAPPYPPSVHLMMGLPSDAGSDPSKFLMQKPEFAVSYNRDLGRPNWVSWHLSNEWVGTLTRNDTFRPDPQVPPDWYRVQSFDFSGSGFDRGHMTPNADRDKETSIPINEATFLMSNMVAQAPGNNQGPWASLEGYLRTLTSPANTAESGNNDLFIVSGPVGEGGTGSLGGVTNRLAANHVSVPASTWKVALVVPRDPLMPTDVAGAISRVDCTTRTIAVIMPNNDGIRNDPWQNYLTTVDAVEALTGYDFFSNLPEPYQRCIEAGTNGNNPSLVKGDQAITFPQPADSIYGDAPFTVSATGGASGSPVTFAAAGACSSSGLNGATITILTPGACTITASQAGSVVYNAAPNVVRTLNVERIAQTITFDTLPDRTYGDAPFTVSAGGGASGNPVTFAVSGSCAASGVNGSTITLAGIGVCTVTASQAGTVNYAPAGNVARSFQVMDRTAPVIASVRPSVTSLWPPNKKMVPVSLAASVADDVDPAPACQVVAVSSNEGTAADWQITGALRVELRADRAGSGSGRIYVISVRCTDASGNAATATATVTVPHDQGK